MAVIAVERLGKNGAQNFAVNPGTEWTIKKTDNIFVIADDMEDALSIANLSENDTFPDIEFPARGKIKSETRFKGSPVHRNNAVLEQVSFNNHIIICGIPSGLLTLIEPLRSEDLNDFQRIVILSEKSPTETEWQAIEKLNEIYYVKGSPLKFDDLKRAGIMACSKALILANTKSMSKSEQVMVDADTVMTVMGIEYLQESVYSIAELVYASNIKFLKAQFPVEGGGHNRFSVDETIAVSRIADSLICQAYYTPHVLEIFDEVFSVDKDCGENIRNTCEFYQIRLPDVYSTRSYGELFNYLSTNLGIIPIGLYRKSPAEEYYVLTNPPADTKIRIDDCVYVLSPDEPKL